MSIIKDFIVKAGIVVQGTSSTVSTQSGALIVAGGASFAENVYVGGIGTFGALPHEQGSVSTTTTGVQTLRVTGGGASVIGASIVDGALAVTGQVYFTNATPANNTATAAVTVAGGFGVGEDIYAGGIVYSSGSQVITVANLAGFGVSAVFAGTDTAVSANTGSVTVWNTSTLQSVTERGNATKQSILIGNATTSSSTGTGALVVQGGVGVNQNINAGGTITAGGNITAAGYLHVATTASFGSGADATSVTSGSVRISGGLAVAKQIYAQIGVITTNSQSTTVVGNNALALTAGGLGVQGTGLFGGNVVLQSTLNSASTNSSQALLVAGGVGVGGNLSAFSQNIVDTKLATGAGDGALRVSNGGVYIGQNLIVNSSATSTTTNTANALYVKGGAWFDNQIFVQGVATFNGNVIFNGTSTNVYSTNTVYTDNLINIHVPPGSTGTDHNWTFDDGKDIGLGFHYYKTVDKNAFLGLANDSGYLEWFEDGYETTTGVHTSGTYGTFLTGAVRLVRGNANAANTTTGDLIVLGGAGINGALYIGGQAGTASTSTVNAQGLVVSNNGLGVTGDSYFASNVGINGTYGLHVANNVSAAGTVIVTGGSGSSTSVGGQGLQVTVGGIGVAGASYINGAVGITGITTIANGTNAAGTNSGALIVQGGAGIGQDLYVGGTVYGNVSGIVSTATNLQGGQAGSIPIQGGSGITGFIPLGPAGFILTAGATTATWQSAGALSAGTATNAINVSITTTNVSANYYLAFANTTTGFAPLIVDTNLNYNANTDQLTLSGTNDSTTSTNGTLVISGGVGVAKQVVIGQTMTNYGPINLINGTAATGVTSGALRVTGGVGVQGSLYAAALFDQGNRVVTRVTPSQGTGIGITAATTVGTATSFTIANFGVTSLQGSTYISVSASTGSVTIANLGVQTLSAGTDTQVSSSTGTVTVWNTSTLQSITVRGASTDRDISIIAGTNATSTGTGALQVRGGVGVSRDLYIGGTLVRTGAVSAAGWLTAGIGISVPAFTATDTTLTGAQGTVAIHSLGIPTIAATGGSPTYSNAATVFIDGAPVAGSGATITNPWSLYVNNGNIRFNAGTQSTTTATGALQVMGGVGIGGNVNAGGSVTAGTAATGQTINGFLTNNTLIATYNSTAISTTATQNLDTWSTSSYRTAKYMVQLVDTAFGPHRVHATEMMVFHDGGGNVYKSEYGVVTSVGELGTFDAVITGTNVQLQFTPAWPTLVPSSLTIKVYRTAITL